MFISLHYSRKESPLLDGRDLRIALLYDEKQANQQLGISSGATLRPMRPSPQKLLTHADVPVLLLTDLTNLRYLTGLSMSSGVLLVLPRSYVLFTDARYLEMAEHQAHRGVMIRDITELDRFLQKVRVCGFEQENVTVGRLLRWKTRFPSTKFVRVKDVLEEFRRRKDPEELRILRRAERITKELLRRVPSMLRSTTTERSLAWKLRQWAQELGAEGMSFDPIVAFGTHTSRPHHQPTSRQLQKGHIVQIDVGAVYKGYCGDLSRVYFTAQSTPAQERAYRAVMEAKNAVIDEVRVGASTRALDQLARSILKKHGMEEAFTHALGHGVGLDVHEGVTLSSRQPDRKLLRGEVITVEPGVYFPGCFGIRLEDMVVVE